MSTIAPCSLASIEDAANLLRQGEIIGFPTETVYGLGADAYNEVAVKKIYQIKGRPSHNPLITHIASLDQLPLVTTKAALEDLRQALNSLEKFIPGPLSLVLPKNDRLAPTVTAGLPTVAVRIPSHADALSLLRLCDFPVAAPSANPSNYVSPTSAQHVQAQLGDRIPLILDGGPCSVGIESTILDLSAARPMILRQGGVTSEELSRALGMSVEELLASPTETKVKAPGMLREHYSPLTPIRLLHSVQQGQLPPRTGLIYVNAIRRPQAPGMVAERPLSREGDLNEVSRNLFAALREFDTLKLDLIVIEACEPAGVGRAIMDRINRACAKTKQENT